MSPASHNGDTTFHTTYRREYACRQLDIMAMPVSLKSSSTSQYLKKQRRLGRRPVAGPGRNITAPFELPGRSMTVGPAVMSRGSPRIVDPRQKSKDDVSESLNIRLGDKAPTRDYDKWLISKLPDIVERCCRSQNPQPAMAEALQPPLRRKIRINVSSSPHNPTEVDIENTPRGSPSPRQDVHSSHLQESPEVSYVYDAETGLHQVQHVRRSRMRLRHRAFRRSSSEDGRADAFSSKWESSSCSHSTAPNTNHQHSAVTPEAQATADLVRHVLEDMFGSHASHGSKVDATTSTGYSTVTASSSHCACQTSPRFIGATRLEAEVQTDSSEPGPPRHLADEWRVPLRRRQSPSPTRRWTLGRRNTIQERTSPRGRRHSPEKVYKELSSSVQYKEQSSSVQYRGHSSPVQIQSSTSGAGSYPNGVPERSSTSRRILDTLTESNRLLSEMADFFRRSELADRVTQRTDLQLVEEELRDAEKKYFQMKEMGLSASPLLGNLRYMSAPASADDRYRQANTRSPRFRSHVYSPTGETAVAEIYAYGITSPMPAQQGFISDRSQGLVSDRSKDDLASEKSHRRAAESAQIQARHSSSAIPGGVTSLTFRTGSDGEILGRQRQSTQSLPGNPPSAPAQRQPQVGAGEGPLPDTVTARSWARRKRREQQTPSPAAAPSAPQPDSATDSPPSTTHSQWEESSVAQVALHSGDRPYRPLQSPPPTAAVCSEAPSAAAGAGAASASQAQPCGSSTFSSSPRLPWPVSPAGDHELPPCSHRHRLERERSTLEVDSTDLLLSYDPWTAIENDFKNLLH